MKISKILNNNVITTIDEASFLEKVVMGKGIAFNKKVGDYADEGIIEKVFNIDNKSESESSRFQKLISKLPIEYINIAEKIINYTREILNIEFNDHIYIALADHLLFAVQRITSGVEIKNGLLWEIQRIYQKEYQISLLALSWIEKELGVKMPKDEAGFIAMHLINSSMGETMVNTISITTIIEDTLKIIKYYFAVDFDEESVAFGRLLTHLKFLAQRVVSKKNFEEDEDEDLSLLLKEEKYAKPYDCSSKIQAYIQKNYDYIVTTTELIYLSIYIKKVISRSAK